MGLLNTILGRPAPFPLDSLAAMQAAGASLSEKGYAFAGKAGICLKKDGPTKLVITGMLAGAALPVRYELATDEYCCTWIVLRGDLSAIVAATTKTCRILNESRSGGSILCVAFEFRKDDRKVYWIYNRGGLFYPFVPKDSEHDVLLELKMQDAGTGMLPVEGKLTRWYPIWGMPF
jgi:hypothetical protein